eukprot:TRINITY_DN16254_c0_g1_i1.p1 TRINITY_DN16254_c0_g1~~TRINITY_DN16254_c0_g1_i1.p1  ORF type:complete len:207 (+),score=36.40 TRINITY_DN16254_c0_g1_i1:16-636(+)
MAFYSVFFDSITAYTGLSPAAFFTIVALMVGIYRMVSGMFVGPDEIKEKRFVPMESLPMEPVKLGDVTEDELKAYDGSDLKKPLLMAIKGQIYDVTRSRMFYGPGGPYALFAGRDASRALALMSFEPKDLTGNIEGLSPSELDTLQDWEYKFMEKYVKVGQLVTEKSTEEIGSAEKIEESHEPKRDGEDICQDSDNKIAETEVGNT